MSAPREHAAGATGRQESPAGEATGGAAPAEQGPGGHAAESADAVGREEIEGGVGPAEVAAPIGEELGERAGGAADQAADAVDRVGEAAGNLAADALDAGREAVGNTTAVADLSETTATADDLGDEVDAVGTDEQVALLSGAAAAGGERWAEAPGYQIAGDYSSQFDDDDFGWSEETGGPGGRAGLLLLIGLAVLLFLAWRSRR